MPLATSKPRLVLLGMMTKMPVAGVVWQAMHYVVGFQRLGFDVYYVEDHGRTPGMLMSSAADDPNQAAAAFIQAVMQRFGLGDNWAYHSAYDDCYLGMSPHALRELFRSAELVIDLHGGTEPQPDHWATNRLLYLETDPVELQIELFHGLQSSIDFLAPHFAFFTFGENYGRPDCGLPVTEKFDFKPTRQPVLLDMWAPDPAGDAETREAFTTIGNWRQPWRRVKYRGEVYQWTKDMEFKRVLDLPSRTAQPLELALSSFEPEDRVMLEEHGWRVTESMAFSLDLDAYRGYIRASRGEFTVAKDQNVRLRSGWFSDRSATYLAAGRPVINQETGFSNILPTGEGLFAFITEDDILGAIDKINSDYERHCKAALEIAHEYFDAGKVLTKLLDDAGIPVPASATGAGR